MKKLITLVLLSYSLEQVCAIDNEKFKLAKKVITAD